MSFIALVAVMLLGVVDAWGFGINKYVSLSHTQEVSGKQVSWASDNTIKWTQSHSNLYWINDLRNKDLSQYDGISVNVSSASSEYRIILTVGNTNYTISTKNTGQKFYSFKDDFKCIASLGNASIRIGGGKNNSGQMKISSIALHKTVNWDSNGKITFTAADFNLNSATYSNGTFKFNRNNDINLAFDDNSLSSSDIKSITLNLTNSSNFSQKFEDGKTICSSLDDAKSKKIGVRTYRIVAKNNSVSTTFTSVVFTRNVATQPTPSTPSSNFDVTSGRIFFEDFENLDNNSARNGNKGIESVTSEADKTKYEQRPENYTENNKSYQNSGWQGKYLNYGGRGKIMSDPAFNHYYQNLADADVHTKSIAENYLRMIFTDTQKRSMMDAINAAGTGNRAATIGFWINGKVAVENELPLERGSMFSIFSNYRFRKADNYDEKPRFMFDLACNGWTYSYMPNNDGAQKDNYFFYGEKSSTNSSQNPLTSLFGKDNYVNTLDQGQRKFYDDKKWHYVSYVLDKDFTRVTIYLDGVQTGRIDDITKLDKNKFEVLFENGGDYVGRFFYLRNIVLGGFTPHGLFYDKQYYSDAAMAYDDIAIYSKALTAEQIKSIIEQKGYTPQEWYFCNEDGDVSEGHGTSFVDKTAGLGLNNPQMNEDGNLVLTKGTEITIPNVPKGSYVRVEYKYVDANDQKRPTSTNNNLLSYVGVRDSENEAGFETTTFHSNATSTYNFFLTVNSPIEVRSIVITPYQYADLQWAQEKVQYDVVGTTFKQNNTVVTPTYPALHLNVDGKRNADGTLYYENIASDFNKTNKYIQYSSSSPHVATVTAKGGVITPTRIAGDTYITAEVISDNLYEGSNTTASFEVVIKKEENTLRVANGSEVSVNDKFPEKYKEDHTVSSDKLKNVTFTVGGWPYNGGEYTVDGETTKDDWSKSTNAGVKKNENIDDFSYYTKGTNNALSESIGYEFNDGDRGQVTGDGKFYPESKFQHNLTPWTLPCRGSFIKVEPVKAGLASVYVFQEGNLWKDNASDNHSSHVAWRPLYIADETGQLVDFVQTATNGKIGENDNFFVDEKRRAQFLEDIEALYNSDPTLRKELIALRDDNHDRFRQLIDHWENAGWKQQVIPTNGDGTSETCGFMVMSDAIVRYTFNVLPGKTYYMFSNDTKVALSGFNFEEGRLLRAHEDDYDSNPLRQVQTASVTLSDAANYTVDASKVKDEVSVTYSGRTFTAGKWSSICLPYSMNNRQMKEQFGDDAKVIMLKKIENGYITFVYHVNQDIIAGYPYLILPSKTTSKVSFNAYNDGKVASPLFSITETGKTLFDTPSSTLNQYVFEGTLSTTTVNQYGYAMSSTGNLTRLTTTDASKRTLKPYRAFLNYYGDEESAKSKQLRMTVEGFDENEQSTSTAIEDMLFDQGILTQNADVYSVNGQKVKANASTLNGLDKGVFIINGRKVVK